MEKIIFTLLALIVMMPVAVAAETITQDDTLSLFTQLTDYKNEFDQLKAKRATLAKRHDDLQWSQKQIEKQIDAFYKNRNDLKNRIDIHQKNVRDHDSRCSGTFEDQAYVDDCNHEASQLDTITHAQRSEHDSLKRAGSLLKTATETQLEESNKVIAADRVAAERQKVIARLSRPIIERLKPISSKNVLCQKAIAAVDADPTNMAKKEIMHSVCGEMFDGNK